MASHHELEEKLVLGPEVVVERAGVSPQAAVISRTVVAAAPCLKNSSSAAAMMRRAAGEGFSASAAVTLPVVASAVTLGVSFAIVSARRVPDVLGVARSVRCLRLPLVPGRL